MSKIPTAKEFLHQSKSLHDMWDNTRGKGEWDEKAIINSHIEFAKLHVEAALEEAKKKSEDLMSHSWEEEYEQEILNVYPLTNIK